ncbi:hypothetical protein ONS95_006820 [Cadophora gregata]|uniref:uncharacterized protein n=1 Tax=Cadophora gregata TaxID=51156 RepID=UPI0026DD7566|nr:uncharacterized protein ONS95_006820 [Cadophora gregata]KAK0101660.1 hypothetical protein ONS95_006820 [Cadophora gregata]KAK0106324.1 hypothetical protein ONS96_003960 [Cadophora gregata f. sp. sojae]
MTHPKLNSSGHAESSSRLRFVHPLLWPSRHLVKLLHSQAINYLLRDTTSSTGGLMDHQSKPNETVYSYPAIINSTRISRCNKSIYILLLHILSSISIVGIVPHFDSALVDFCEEFETWELRRTMPVECFVTSTTS